MNSINYFNGGYTDTSMIYIDEVIVNYKEDTKMKIFDINNTDLCKLTLRTKSQISNFVRMGGLTSSKFYQDKMQKYTELRGELAYRGLWSNFVQHYSK